MKKIAALFLMAALSLTLAACGGGTSSELADAARQIEEITGAATTPEEVQEAIDQLAELSGEPMTPEEFVEFTREMYAFAEGDTTYEPEDDPWPFEDIPAWPVAEGLSCYDYYGGEQYDLFVTGGAAEMETWLASLREVGFKGYFWGGDDLYYINDDYYVYLEDRGAEEGQLHLVVTPNDEPLGMPVEIADLFPAYNGDGALVYGGSDEWDGITYHFFSAVGETEEGGQRYLQALLDAGFAAGNDYTYYGAGGYYYKTVGDQKIGYESEEYWYEYDDETGTGWADFGLTVAPAA